MKSVIFLFGIWSFFFCFSAQAAPSSLVGSWQCSASLQKPLFRLTLKSQDQYTSQGDYHTKGVLTAALNGQPVEVKYAVSGDGQWHLSQKTLELKSRHLTFKNISNPEWEAFLNLKQYIPKQASGSFQIKALTQQHLVLNNRRLSQNIECERQ
ncbi:hypothetical protein [Vibrio quintilis]|uniref:DUF306 domain-containing protein n=1 Tax=Vibrio quintilis TaxID=1117707 RepID=A0A1M7YXR9_9VIBR|nr:hypothetical protein [Vibrio quintilis]SHO57343.1 hypothetical protein VQ7734_03112 [Vibrio quintilis]